VLIPNLRKDYSETKSEIKLASDYQTAETLVYQIITSDMHKINGLKSLKND
jgi:hypothetical protein